MIFQKLNDYSSKVNWLVFCMVCFFTIGAWLDINGLWCELPVMVHQLPENWRLPSILSATTQIAQVGPILFLIGKYYSPNVFTYVRAIYVILGIGSLSCLLLSFFWNATITIGENSYSIGLYILNFSLAILDGTSSVTFLPYIGGNFIKEYIIPNYIGESLAALIPSILSLSQGLGQDLGCRNETKVNETTNQTYIVEEPIPIVPNYSVEWYFRLMFLLLVISTGSFTCLNYSKIAVQARKKSAISAVEPNSKQIRISPSTSPNSRDPFDVKSNSDDSLIVESEQNLSKESHDINTINQNYKSIRNEKIILLSYVFWLSFICYGVLPGLQSYSTLPYGNSVFNYAVNLSFVFLPISIFLSIWSYEVSVKQITIEYSIACAFSLYIVILSIMSPCPPLMDNWFGPFLTIISWIMSQAMFMRCRCLIATRLERFGQKTLLKLGALTMIGQIFGGLIIFLIVNVFNLLVSLPSCKNSLDYCKMK